MTDNITESASNLSLEELFPPIDNEQTLTVVPRGAEILASRLALAVEDCDAHIVNLNITRFDSRSVPVEADLRIVGGNRLRIVRALDAAGYSVKGEEADESEADTFRDRVNELLLYLNIK